MRRSSSVETSSILMSIEGWFSQRFVHILLSIESEVPRIISAFGMHSTRARRMTDDLVSSMKIACLTDSIFVGAFLAEVPATMRLPLMRRPSSMM